MNDHQTTDRFINSRELALELAMGWNTVKKLMGKPGCLPPAYQFGPRIIRWRLSEVRAWVAARPRTSEYSDPLRHIKTPPKP